jgi:NTP pyrophosphatase (non-canonical NTP hydrolase)
MCCCFDDFENEMFRKCWVIVQDKIHKTAFDKGWWDEDRNDGEIIALIHSELSEALEALRHGNPPDDKIPEFSGLEAELADAVIRIMDYAGGKGLDVAGALVRKIEFNETRERKHGKEF